MRYLQKPLIFAGLAAAASFLLSNGFGPLIAMEEVPLKEEVFLTQDWETMPSFKTPESVCYDILNQVLYVSNVNGKPRSKDGNGFISKLGLDGEIIDLYWVEGLHAPKGMGIKDGWLYVTDIDQVVIIDVNKGEIRKQVPIEGARLLNDIAVDGQGTVYISDTINSQIFTMKDGTVETWVKGGPIRYPNGLLVHENHLLVGCNNLLAIDLETREISEWLEDTGDGIDGIAIDPHGHIVFSHWQGSIHHIHPGHPVLHLIETKDRRIQTADMDVALDHDQLYVATFSHNTVIAFKLH